MQSKKCKLESCGKTFYRQPWVSEGSWKIFKYCPGSDCQKIYHKTRKSVYNKKAKNLNPPRSGRYMKFNPQLLDILKGAIT